MYRQDHQSRRLVQTTLIFGNNEAQLLVGANVQPVPLPGRRISTLARRRRVRVVPLSVRPSFALKATYVNLVREPIGRIPATPASRRVSPVFTAIAMEVGWADCFAS
jgi:hypothetical protein